MIPTPPTQSRFGKSVAKADLLAYFQVIGHKMSLNVPESVLRGQKELDIICYRA